MFSVSDCLVNVIYDGKDGFGFCEVVFIVVSGYCEVVGFLVFYL